MRVDAWLIQVVVERYRILRRCVILLLCMHLLLPIYMGPHKVEPRTKPSWYPWLDHIRYVSESHFPGHYLDGILFLRAISRSDLVTGQYKIY